MNFQNLVDYCQDFGLEDILSGVSVPEPLVVKDVKSAIMVKCGLLAPVYSDPDTMRNMIKFWFISHRWNIDHLIKIILADYSPIENYDRYEDVKTDRKNKSTDSGNDVNAITGNDVNALSGEDSFMNGHMIENQKAAFNTSNYSNDEKEIHSGDDITTYGKTETFTHGKTETLTHGKITDDLGEEHTVSHLHGNIGVTTNQQMIEAELKLLQEFNIYDWIASRIEDDLFITVY